jgi:phage antirepressor YoqD-like protein
MNNVINIATTTVRMDEDGRYCLNDIHKAAGGDAMHQPAFFLRNAKTSELIQEIRQSANMQTEPTRTIRGGNVSGTFVVKELVYAYAMWISPSFHLKVIRAFDTLQTRGVAVADHAAADLQKNPLKYMRELLEQAEEIEAKLAVAQPKADVFDATCALNGENITRFVRSLPMVNSLMIKRDLMKHGYLYKAGGSYRVYAKYRDTMFTEKVNPYSSRDFGSFNTHGPQRLNSPDSENLELAG